MKTAVMPKIEYRSYPVELEDRNNKITQLEDILKTAKSEKRSLSNSEQTRFNAIKKEIEQIDLKLAEDSLKEIASGKFETRGLSEKDQKEIRSFVQFVRSGGTESRDLTSNGSGVVIPKSISDRVISRIREISPIFERMTHYNVTGQLSLPVYDFMSHQTVFTQDLANITATSGSFLTADLKSFPIVSLAKIGRSLINQTSLDVINVIVEQIAMSFADFISRELITNASATLSGTLASVANTVTAETAGEIGVDDLISLQMAVPSVFQPNSAFLMHPTTFSRIRKMKDTTGQPLLIAGNENLKSSLGYTLLGSEVLLDENVAPLASGARAIFYGSFADGLACNTNAPMTTQILVERFSDQYAIGVLVSTEIDTNLTNSRALSVLIGA